MSTRNFEFRSSPRGAQRDGGFMSPATGTAIVIGAPVKVNTAAAANELNLPTVQLATGPQVPQPGLSGIAYYEYIQYQGDDPYLTTFSDKDTVPLGKALQVVSGDSVRVCLRNTSDVVFLNDRTYEGRQMVNDGSGATPNVDVGSYLTPGQGTDTDGYWAVTVIAANAWLVVTAVNDSTGEVTARMLF